MIDNISTDASVKIVRQYPRIQLLFEAKQGSYAARNRGLREAKGEIIAFTDADCVPSPDWLDEIVAALAQPGIEIVLGHRKFVGNSFLLPMLAAYDHEKHNYVFNSGIKELYYGHTNNMGIGKKLFDELGPFVERARGADTIFVRQSVNRYSCEVVRYCPQMQVRHMEIDSLYNLYRKYFIYGRSSRSYGRIVDVKSLTNRDRMLFFATLFRANGTHGWNPPFSLGCLEWACFPGV
jgi:glycosyltransferase involved in cell wall biosynthesis